MPHRLFLDFENRSVVDLEKRGLDNYAHNAQVLLAAYAFGQGPVSLWQTHLGPMPADLRDALDDPFVTKVAWNSEFERIIAKHVLGIDIPASEFLDPMIWARHLSMAGNLEDVCRITGLPPELAKKPEGKDLIKLFCVPADPGGQETLFGISEPSFHDWQTRPQEWQRFTDYCRQDVVAERAILEKLEKFPLPPQEQRAYVLDQRINERGVPVDLSLVRGASAVAETAKTLLRVQLKTLTQLENPNSNTQFLRWVQERGYKFSGLAKGFVDRALAGECKLTDAAKEALILRKQTSKTSDSKLDRIRELVSADGRLRHQLNFVGSARAGRWSGKDVQVHNFPRPPKAVEKNLPRALELLRAGDYNAVAAEFEYPLEIATGCLRSSFRAPAGYRFIVVDLNAVEYRVLGWIARSQSILEVSRAGRCPYLSFGSRMYGVPYEELEAAYFEGDSLAKQRRQDSKPPVLGAGYRLGGGEEIVTEDGDKIKTGLWGYAENMHIEMDRQTAHLGVKTFREAHPEVVQLWYDLENASFETMKTGQPVEVGRCVMQAFGPKKDRKLLRILLPSGRGLHYIRPKIEDIEFMGNPKKTITYEGKDQKKQIWKRIATQGGKWTENIVQAVARDLLLNGMFLAEERGMPICLHVHDELVVEVPEDSPLGVADLRTCMIERPAWADADLLIDADGFSDVVYRKG